MEMRAEDEKLSVVMPLALYVTLGVLLVILLFKTNELFGRSFIFSFITFTEQFNFQC